MQASELHVQQIPAEPPRRGAILGGQRKAIPTPLPRLRLPPFEDCISSDLASSPAHPRYDKSPLQESHSTLIPRPSGAQHRSVALDPAIFDEAELYSLSRTKPSGGTFAGGISPYWKVWRNRIASTGSIGALRAASFSTTKTRA